MKKLIFIVKICIALFMAGNLSCKKSSNSITPPSPPGEEKEDTDTSYNPSDPGTAATVGFFLDNWQPKVFTPPDKIRDAVAFTGTADVNIAVDMNLVVTRVSKYLFGNNSNTWMGQMVDQPKLIQYIKDLSPNIIRGPGGSISDIYFWNQAAAPPPDAPDQLLDGDGKSIPGGYWYGMNAQGWTLSIDNYYQMLRQTNSEGIITANFAYSRYGTGPNPVATAAHLAADWVRYDMGRTKYWEIGNENNGSWEAGYQIDVSKNHDGQPSIISGELYGKHFKIFADSMRAAANEQGRTIYIGAQLLGQPPASWQTTADKNWNEGILKEAGREADFFVVHDYFTQYYTDASASEILNTGLNVPKNIVSFLNSQFSQYGVPPKPIALTEWNIFSTGSKQMVSDIAGVHAAIVLGELIKNKFGEACRWDLANGWDDGNDHGMFNNGDEPGGVPEWNPRPAFFYMYYFQKIFGDRMVSSSVEGSQDILCYASSFGSGDAGMVIINKGNTPKNIKIKVQHFSPGDYYYWYTLTGETGSSGFSRKVFANESGPSGIAGGPANYANVPAYRSGYNKGIFVTAPPHSAIFLNVSGK